MAAESGSIVHSRIQRSSTCPAHRSRQEEGRHFLQRMGHGSEVPGQKAGGAPACCPWSPPPDANLGHEARPKGCELQCPPELVRVPCLAQGMVPEFLCSTTGAHAGLWLQVTPRWLPLGSQGPAGKMCREHPPGEVWSCVSPAPVHPSWGCRSPRGWVCIPTLTPRLQGLEDSSRTPGFPGAWRKGKHRPSGVQPPEPSHQVPGPQARVCLWPDVASRIRAAGPWSTVC